MGLEMPEYTKEDVAAKIDHEGFGYFISQGFFRRYENILPESLFSKMKNLQSLHNEVRKELEENGFTY